MLKSLVASCLCALSVNSQPLTPSRAITEDINGKYEITYKYESNEVQSNDDLVVGNIYYFSIDNDTIDSFINSYDEFAITFLTIDNYTLGDNYSLEYDEYINSPYGDTLSFPIRFNFVVDYYCYICFPSNIEGEYIYSYYFDNSLDAYPFSLSGVCIYSYDDYQSGQGLYTLFSYTDYNEIVSIREIRSHNNLYRLLYDFYYSIFSDEDLAEISTGYNMPFDNWLAHTCTIITLLVLVFVCFLFLKWLFKVISGLILLKH